MRNHDVGIICYAGLDKPALWRQAKQHYSCPEGEGRFKDFMPLFPIELVQNMRYVGKNSYSVLVSKNGFSIDPAEYHRQMYDDMPDLYSGDNYARNFDLENRFLGRGVFTVDQAWVNRFPQYEPFMGERLVIYLIGGGPQAVAVPESIYPRGGGILHSAEMDMRISARGDHFAAWVKMRVEAGAEYEPLRFQREYLRENMADPVVITQKEIGRIMQDMSLVRSLSGEEAPSGHYSEFARRGEGLPQYTPYHLAADTFERMPITRSTARLVQLYYSGDNHISDFWLPYQEVAEYIDRGDMTLDVRALCAGYQLPPRYDASTGGGRCPDKVRVVSVQDRGLQPMVSNTINNPAYGSGMNPLGMINKLIYLEDSTELLRVGRLQEEENLLQCIHTTLPKKEYIRMVQAAAVQENKGLLIDTLYRREAVLNQLREGTEAYRSASLLLDKQLQEQKNRMDTLDMAGEKSQLSGYDADLDYLHRLEMSKLPPDEDSTQPVFTPDQLRMLSIESGCSMRGTVKRAAWEELRLEEEPEEETQMQPEALEAEETEEANEIAEAAQTVEAAESVETAEPAEEPAPQEEASAEPAAEEAPATPEEPSVAAEAPATPEEPSVAAEAPATPEEPSAAEEAPATPEEPSVAAEAPATPEEPSIAAEAPAAEELSAGEKLKQMMADAPQKKPKKSLWSRTLPKAEQLSLFETPPELATAHLSMEKTLGGAPAAEKNTAMQQLLGKKTDE